VRVPVALMRLVDKVKVRMKSEKMDVDIVNVKIDDPVRQN
jgi:hypothetical protein